jgi:hypothetical protein
MRIAFATCAAIPEGTPDDRSAARALAARFAVWDDPGVDWEAYDLVVLRSTWDYTHRPEAFLAWCRGLGDRLRNPAELVAFNADKRYLGELSVPTVPTVFVAPGEASPVLRGEVVVKPNVSAGARNTGRFGPAAHDQAAALIERITASGRTALVQPYLAGVDVRGEVALVHFAGRLSHVLVKRAVLAPDEVAPVAAGSAIGVAAVMLEDDLVAPGLASEAEVALASAVLEEIAERFGGPPLYARVDLLPDATGAPMLLELEAVEPNLYLGVSPGAAERFAAAVRGAVPNPQGGPAQRSA